jgi:hypothetical protein
MIQNKCSLPLSSIWDGHWPSSLLVNTQLPFVPAPDLFAVNVDCLCSASRFLTLASRLDIFPGFGSTFYPIAGGRSCADGRGCDYAAWWIVRRPAGCVRGFRARIDGTRIRAGAGACTLDLLIGFISALGPPTTLGVWS